MAAAKRKGKRRQAAPGAKPKPKGPATPVAAEGANETKQRLLDACAKAVNRSGVFTPPDDCREIERATIELERLNSAKNIANTESRLLNGEWKLLFATAESVSAGLWGPFVGEVKQTLDAGQREFNCTSTFFGGAVELQWDATWTATGSQEVTLPGEDWYPYLFGNRLSLWSLSNDDGVALTMTYTDSNLRIFRQNKIDRNMNRTIQDLYIFQK